MLSSLVCSSATLAPSPAVPPCELLFCTRAVRHPHPGHTLWPPAGRTGLLRQVSDDPVPGQLKNHRYRQALCPESARRDWIFRYRWPGNTDALARVNVEAGIAEEQFAATPKAELMESEHGSGVYQFCQEPLHLATLTSGGKDQSGTGTWDRHPVDGISSLSDAAQLNLSTRGTRDWFWKKEVAK